MSIAYYNGKICEVSEVAVPLTDRAVFFGDGIYDAAIGRGGVIYLEDEHIDRFIGNANKMGIPLPFGRRELVRLLRELVMRSERRSSSFIFSYRDTVKKGGTPAPSAREPTCL